MKEDNENIKIVEVPVGELLLSEYNPRKWPEKEGEDLAASIKKFGLVDPLIVNAAKERKNTVIGGHFRLQIAKNLGYKTVPVVYVNIPDLKKEQELNLRLNRNLGQWDWDLLANFDEELLLDVGFESVEIDRILKGGIEEDDFDAEAEAANIKKPKSKRGEIYQLGKHFLMCGDATSREDVAKLIDGKKADMVFTDPPYNVNYKGTKYDEIKNDNMDEEAFILFAESFVASMHDATKDGGIFYICSGYSSFPTFLYALRSNGFEFSTPIIWVKNNTSLGWGDYRHKHEMVIKTKNPKIKRIKRAEPILYGWKKGKHFFAETRFEADVWEIKRRASNMMAHPTQKPLELVKRALENSTQRGEIILDLFGGSGSTLIAAEQTGRECRMMEISEVYCDVIRKRYNDFVEK